MKAFFLSVLAMLFLSSPAQASEPIWTRVLSGDVVAGPLDRADRVYVAGSDRTITCISETGRFLWSRAIPGKTAPLLTVTKSGMVVAASGSGALSALNMDGMFLWQMSGKDLPVTSPIEGWDGRSFLIYANRVVCVSPSAAIKWTLPLGEKPIEPISETGSGDLLFSTASGVILRVSPYGELLERSPLPEMPTVILPLASGFAAAFNSGFVRGYDVRNRRSGESGTALLWEYRAKSSVSALAEGKGTLVVLSSDGSLAGLNVTDGSALWVTGTGHPVRGKARIAFEYGQFNIAYRGFACAKDTLGPTVWEYPLPEASGESILSGNGIAYVQETPSTLSAFRVETRIIGENKAQKTKNYGILNGTSVEYRTPFLADRIIIAEYFARVATDIENGTVGPDEVSYARRLSEILRNDTAGSIDGRVFDPIERGRAASLLGKLGSAEYRTVLLGAASGESDPSVLIGILYGLSASGYDGDGETLKAIEAIVRQVGVDRAEVHRAACDALYSIVRYSGGKIALEATRALTRFTQSPYGNLTREYARQALENILR